MWQDESLHILGEQSPLCGTPMTPIVVGKGGNMDSSTDLEVDTGADVDIIEAPSPSIAILG